MAYVRTRLLLLEVLEGLGGLSAICFAEMSEWSTLHFLEGTLTGSSSKRGSLAVPKISRAPKNNSCRPSCGDFTCTTLSCKMVTPCHATRNIFRPPKHHSAFPSRTVASCAPRLRTLLAWLLDHRHMQCSRDGTSLRVYLGTRISHVGSIAFGQGNPRKSL